jgi:hypothetical protein
MPKPLTERHRVLVAARALAEARARREAERTKLDIDRLCFGQQKRFVKDERSYVTGVCSRRAGKTHGVALKILDVAEKKRAPVLYFTHTRGSAKRIIWHTLLDMNRKHNLGFDVNESDLVLKKDGRALVHLTGVDTKTEIEKIRGTPWALAVGDEAQGLPSYMKDLVEDVLGPSFIDHDGKLRLIGTPGPVPTGYFYECTQNQKWGHHAWTVFDNPHIEGGAHKKLAEYLELTGYTRETPKIQREWYGKWVHDLNSLVFRYDPTRNDFDILPTFGEWRYVIGVDIGYDDADAIAVLAWSPEAQEVWLVEEIVQAKQDISSLANQLRSVRSRLGERNVVAIVMDTGGIGKKVEFELSGRWSIPVMAAQKSEKQVHIELLNDALRTRKLFARRDSRFAHDSYLVEWDKERSTPDRRYISDRFHSDICDAVLYAYRAATAWTTQVKGPPVDPHSNEGVEAWRKEMLDRQMALMEKEKAQKAEAESILWTPEHMRPTMDDWGIG